MELSKLIKKDLMCYISAQTKKEALSEIVEMLYEQKSIVDVTGIKKMILAREELMSTGIGLEIGVPHVRTEGIASPIIGIGISKQGVADYVSLDNKPVKLIFMIIVDKGAHKEYIQLLSQVATMLKDEDLRNKLIGAESIDEAYQYLSA